MNKQKRQYYADNIVKRLQSGEISEGLRIGIAVETQEKGDDIKRRILEQMPDAADRWEIAIIPMGGQESTAQ